MKRSISVYSILLLFNLVPLINKYLAEFPSFFGIFHCAMRGVGLVFPSIEESVVTRKFFSFSLSLCFFVKFSRLPKSVFRFVCCCLYVRSTYYYPAYSPIIRKSSPERVASVRLFCQGARDCVFGGNQAINRHADQRLILRPPFALADSFFQACKSAGILTVSKNLFCQHDCSFESKNQSIKPLIDCVIGFLID